MKREVTFDRFMQLVDDFIGVTLSGLTSADLPDYFYRDAYDQGEGAKTTAKRAIKAAKK